MRKGLLILILIIITLSTYSQKKSFSRFSLTAEYGYNYFDGDINQNLTSIFPASIRDITYGASLEYALTPVWGVSVDYYHFPLRAENFVPRIIVNTDMHSASVNATVNFTRMLFPLKAYKLFLIGSVGAGYAYYEFKPYNPIDPSDPLDGPPATLLLEAGQPIGRAFTVPVSFALEYNFSKSFALGSKIQYRSHNKDNLEGIAQLNWKGVTNDFIGTGYVYARYKFNANNRNHLRNIRWNDYAPDEGLALARELKDELAGINAKLNDVDKKVDAVDKKVDNLLPRIENIEQLLSNDGVDSDGDGVPDHRDKHPNTPADTPVDFWGRPLANVEPAKQGRKSNSNAFDDVNSVTYIPSVYFDFDRINLSTEALITISKVAQRLKDDPEVLLEIRGYTDYLGTDAYNAGLRIRRAERVKKELVEVWGIEAARIKADGNGKTLAPKMKYAPNRRCDFFFSK